MSMKKYKLSFLPLFEADLIEITDYISNRLNNPEAALRLVDDIEAWYVPQYAYFHQQRRDSL